MIKVSLIFSTDFQFQIIQIVFGDSNKAWDIANEMFSDKTLEKNNIEHYDVVEFSDKNEMNKWIIEQVGCGRVK